jgi:hypothetical protein
MSGRVVGRVFERIIGSATEKAVLTCLAEHSNPDGEMAFPSVWRISQETELAESTVRAALSNLRANQLIIQTRGPAQHKPATYRVNLDALADLQLVEVYRPGHAEPSPDLQEAEARPPAGSARPLGGGVRPPAHSVRPLGAGPEPLLTVLEPPEPSEEPAASPPPRTSKDQTPWIHALLALKKTLNKADYDTWVRDTEILSISNGSVIIGARNSYGAEWLREHVALNVSDALEKALGRPVKVVFEVAPPSSLPSSLGE